MKEKLLSFQEKEFKNHLPTNLFHDSATIIIYNLEYPLIQLNINLHMQLGYFKFTYLFHFIISLSVKVITYWFY